tara:strand:+ start:7955 stop:8089 length:135 start_codon:yes stop_codon:yes gene_type:complete
MILKAIETIQSIAALRGAFLPARYLDPRGVAAFDHNAAEYPVRF